MHTLIGVTQTVGKKQGSDLSTAKRITLTSLAATISFWGLVAAAPFTASIAQAQTDASQLVLQHPGWIQVPGALVRPDCVHEIPSGASIKMENGKVTGDVSLNGSIIAHYDPCSEDATVRLPKTPSDDSAITNATGNGLVEASYWVDSSLGSSDNIDFVGNDLTVPSKPSKNGAVIYLYNGLENSTETYAFEPTLQYGNNGISGGNYWVIETYFITPGTTYYSPAETVNAGDSLSLFTEIYADSSGTLDWLVEAEDLKTGAFTYQDDTSSGLQWNLPIAGGLAAFNVTTCSDFPAAGKAVFSKTVVDHDFPSYKALTPKWVGSVYSYGGPSCGFKVVPGNKSTLDF